MKTIIKKTAIISALVMGAMSLAPVVHAGATVKSNFAGCTPERTMYFSYTEKHTKAVEFCEVDGGYRYTFGPINKPEMQVVKKPGDIGVISVGMTWGFAMKNGNTFYWISSDKYGETELVVSKNDWIGGKQLAAIPLDGDYGVYENRATEDKYARFAY